MNYEQDLKIDESGLDVEWLRQPQLILKYSKIAAEKRKEIDLKKEALNIIRAEIDRAVRTDPEAYDIIKITETVVVNTIAEQPEYKAANQEVIEANYEYDMARGALQALEHKKTALENLVRLFGQSYFAGPTIPRNLTKEWEEKEKQNMANSSVRIRKRNVN